MDATDSTENTPASAPIIRDKAFARRLEQACEGNPHCPTVGRGKQKWVYDGLREQFGITVSPEATRKWFAGESRPRPKVMSALARLLEVDEGWLSLGIKPDMTLLEKRARSAAVDGVVNLVAGLLQIHGGNIAFPESGREAEADLFVIMAGRQHQLRIALALDKGADNLRFNVPADFDKKTVLGVIQEGENPFSFRVLRLTSELIKDTGHLRGDFYELDIERRGLFFRAGEQIVPEVVSMRDLDGVVKGQEAKGKKGIRTP